MSQQATNQHVFRVYPLRNIFLYNGVTAAHYALGGLGLIIGYDRWPALGWALGAAYLLFAFAQMYVLMPLTVCPSCVYRRLEGARCVSAMNLVSARLTPLADPKDFPKRGQGVFCHNHLYMASLAAPLVFMLPALALGFSIAVLVIFLAIVGLFLFRMFVVFPRFACGRCAARNQCPNAKAMGLSTP